ncbi:hypothetical protein MferCBS31731_001929 [Microsporum ferrugineum]
MLGLITTIFEGSMYLFVVFWSPAIISASKGDGAPDDPPFGLIFASFMTSMMLGSQISSQLTIPTFETPSPSSSPPPPTTLSCDYDHNSVSRCSLFPTTLSTLWAFCVYEFSIGMYYPNVGVLKSVLVRDKDRAKVYALFRLPLNCFVIAGLAFTTEGETCIPG